MGLFSKKPEDEEKLALTELEMKTLELHEARVAMQAAVIEKLQYRERLMLIEQREQLALIRGKQKDCVVSMERARSDYNQTLAGVQERLGVDLKDYVIGEDGTLQLNPETDPEEDADNN